MWSRRALPERYELVAVCFLAAATCYLDRVGFPLAYTVMAQARQTWLKRRTGGVGSRVCALLQVSPLTLSVPLRRLASPRRPRDECTAPSTTATRCPRRATALPQPARCSPSALTHCPSPQIPGGWAAATHGGERVLSLSFLLWCTVSLATPSDGSRTLALMLARSLVGAAMGVVFPSIHSILVQWIPMHERSRAVSLFTSGMYFGSAFAMATLPRVIAAAGPSAVPTLVAATGYAWLALWSRYARRKPPGTVAAAALGDVGMASLLPGPPASTSKRKDVPWAALARCVPLWALVFNNFTFHYAFFILLAWLPTLYDSLGAHPTAAGGLKMMPYLVMGVCSNIGGVAADLLIQRRLGVTHTRKAINTLGFSLASVALLLLPGCTTLGAAVTVACFTMGALALARGGYSVNHMDSAPQLAGVLMGVSNGAGSMAGMVGPWVTGRILDGIGPGGSGAETAAAWRLACGVPAGLCTLGAAVFVLFGTGERLF